MIKSLAVKIPSRLFTRIFHFVRRGRTSKLKYKFPIIKMNIDRGFLNIMILSWGFMLVFTAFQTMGNIEKTVLTSIHTDDPTFTGDGYVSLAIIYAALATCNWLAPSFISITGPRISIFTGCCCYVFFIATFLWPNTVLLYVASAILGFGAALAWTGHGQYLTVNSSSETITRNSGVFWAIFQLSLFTGNLFVYFKFKEEKIDEETRNVVFKVLTFVSIIGMFVLMLMRKTPQEINLGPEEGISSADKELQIPEQPKEEPLTAAFQALKDAFQLLFTPKMLMLTLTFIYTGLVLTFFSGVYSSSVGFTKKMGDKRKSLVGLSGIFVGVGEVIGGALFGILGSKFRKYSGWPVVAAGALIHVFSFIVSFINLPNSAPFADTDDLGLINPSPMLAMAGSLSLGLGDACFNTQVYSIIGTIYSSNSAPAFALFKFSQSLATAISFVYSSQLGLYVQIVILFISLIIGTLAFCFVDIRHKRSRRMSACPEVDSLPVNTALQYND